jgi:general stress protein 26
LTAKPAGSLSVPGNKSRTRRLLQDNRNRENDMASEPKDPQRADRDDVERMWKVMEKQRTPMLVTRGARGLHARPMHAIVRPTEGLIWFLTDRSGCKDWEIARDSQVALTFSNGGSVHLAVSGLARIVDDRETVRDLWSIAAKAYYPDGPEDPDILAIRVEPQLAELWDGPAAPIAMAQMAAALVTGSSAADMGHNVKAELA